MTVCYIWEWLEDVAVLTMMRRLTVADAQGLEAKMSVHYASRRAPEGSWGLVVDVRQSGVLDAGVQEIVKRLMISNVRAGCTAKALVVDTAVGALQSRRLGQEAEQVAGTFESLPDALASVRQQLSAQHQTAAPRSPTAIAGRLR